MKLQRIAAWLLVVRSWWRAHVRTHLIVALLVFLAAFTASIYYASNIRANVRKDLHTAYQRQVRIATTAATSRLQQYETLLRGGAGLFTVTDDVTQDGWTAYFEPYGVMTHYPDVEGIGFSRKLTSDQVPDYLSALQAQGRDDARIFPEGDRPEYVPVTLNAMYNGNTGKSLGYDGYTNPIRRMAMDQAAASGGPVMSGKIELVSQKDPHRAAFIIYLPVYVHGMPTSTTDERKAALYGFVYVAVDMDAMLGNVSKDNQGNHFGMTLYDMADPNKPAYQSANVPGLRREQGSVSSTTQLQLYGHAWKAVFVGSPGLISDNERDLPVQALWRGLLSSVLLTAAVWYIITNRERRFTRLKQMEVQTAKDDLLSLASHQLRTPATVVKQYVGMLIQGYGGELTKQQIGMLDHAYESNERQLEIINQLLYVARLDAGRITLRYQETDMAKLLQEVIRDQASATDARYQTVTYHHPRPLMAEFDPHFFRMVLENLLSNASKYTPEGGSITFGLRKHKDRVIVTIADTGVGMNDDEQHLVFEKFTRVENELSTDVNGSGVGLYLTKQIVELHGGTIAVVSEPAHGSTFTVTLPLRKPAPPPEV